LYYSRVFTVGSIKILFAFVDTWELVGGEADVKGESQRVIDQAQMEWLSQTLSQEGFTYKVVVGHYPVRSVSRDTPGLVHDLLPLLEAKQVDLYLFG
jgi:hypothetical protein